MGLPDPATYWETRLRSDFTLGGVGFLGLGEGFNRWTYRVRRQGIVRAIRTLDLPKASARVLDIGSGTGFMIEIWQSEGVFSVGGSDITDVAVEELEKRFPSLGFSKIDVGAESFPYMNELDAISANDVFYHVVDDERYRRAMRNVFQALTPGGYFLFTENLMRDPLRSPYTVCRTSAEIRGILAASGFEVVDRGPLFVLMNRPVKGGRLLRGWWRGLSFALRSIPSLGAVVGGALYLPELALTRGRRSGPSTELVVCRRPVTG